MMNGLQSRCMALAVLGAIGVAGNALASEMMLDSARFYGRGGAYVAMPDTDDATKANPSTLGEADKLSFQLRVVDFDFIYGKNTQDTVSDLMNVIADDPSPIKVLQTFGDRFGKQNYAAAQLMPFGIRIMNFEFSPFYRLQAQIDPRTPAMPELAVAADSRLGANIAFGLRLGKQLSLGINVRPMLRNHYSGQMTVSDLMDYLPPSEKTLDDLLEQRQGMQVGVTPGMTYTTAGGIRFALLVENAGYAGSINAAADSPPPIPMSVAIGMNYRHALGKSWKWDVAADIHDLTDEYGTQFIQKVRLGTELGTSYFSRDLDLGVMAGVLDGYGSTGAYLDAWIARLEMSVYSRELGEYPGQRRDLRYAYSLKSSMTF